MKVESFEQFWKRQYFIFSYKYHNQVDVLMDLRYIAKKAWEQSKHESNNEG